MKQIISISILVFAFCFTAFAQAAEGQSKAIKVSEYWEDSSQENVKFAVSDLDKGLQKNSTAEGIIKIQARENRTILIQLRKIKSTLKYRGVNPARFSFAISNRNKKIIQYWFVPLTENIPDCEDCIIIRAEDYDKLLDFFNPKPTPKKRKK